MAVILFGMIGEYKFNMAFGFMQIAREKGMESDARML
jgi:hypothetical protein